MSPGAERGDVARNAASAYGERTLLIVASLLLTPYLFRALGPAGFGTWSVMFTVTTVFVMLEEGLASGITALVADARARGRRADLDATLSASIAAMAGLGAAAMLVAAAVAVLADGLAAPSLEPDFRAGLLVLGGAMLVRLPLVAYGAALVGHQRYDLFSGAQASTTVVFVAGTVVAVESGGGVLGVAIAYAGALVVGGAAFVVLLRRAAKDLTLRPRRPERRRLRAVAAFGSFALLAQSAVFVGQRMDTVIVAALRGATAAAPLAAAAKLQSGLQALTLPFVNLLLPMSADLQARGRRAEVARRHELATRVCVQLTLPAAAGVALFAQDITGLWLGGSAPPVTATIIALLAMQTVFLAATPAEKVLVGLGRVRAVSALNVAEATCNVSLSIALVSARGAVGAALGSLLASAAFGPLKWPVACRATGRSAARFLRRSVGAGIASCVPALGAMAAVRVAMEPGVARLAAGLGSGLGLLALVSVAQLGGRSAPARVRAALRDDPARVRAALRDDPAVVRTPGRAAPRAIAWRAAQDVDLTAIIVTHDARDDVLACVRSLEAHHGDLVLAVIVVDNGSRDGTADALAATHPAVEVVRLARNRGIRARNEGLRRARGRHRMFIDSDARVTPGALETLTGTLDAEPGVGLVGPRLVYPGGALQLSARRYPPLLLPVLRRPPLSRWFEDGRIVRRHLMADEPHDRRRRVEYVLGACQVFRAEAQASAGWIDEHIRFGPDDVDWCLKIRRAGFDVVYEPDAEVIHDYRRSTAGRPLSRRALHHLCAFARFQWSWRAERRALVEDGRRMDIEAAAARTRAGVGR